MADETPGTTAEAPAPTAPDTKAATAPPTEAVQDSQPVSSQPDPYAEFPETLREKVKERVAKAREAATNEMRAKNGAEGSWAGRVPAGIREELIKDPESFWRHKAEAEAYRKIVEGGGFGRAPVQETKKTDVVEEVAAELDALVASKPDMSVAEYNRAVLKAQAKVARAIASEEADTRANGVYKANTLVEKEQVVASQPQMQDAMFSAVYEGMRSHIRKMGKPDDPYIAFKMASAEWAKKFPNAPINNAPPIPESPTDTKRTPIAPAPKALSPREKWLRSDGARHLQDD